jgi:DNA primase
MKLEVEKARKRRQNREKKKQEQIDLSPARAMQPKERSIRYDNIKSALAEETVIAQILKEPAMLDTCKTLTGSQFSVPLFGRVYDQLQARHNQGLEVSIAVLEDLTAEETSHLAGICHKQTGPVNEKAFADCVKIILSEQQRSNVSSDDDLLALQKKLKESKGTNL